ncbi:family 16 glycoside hydrolase [Catellatospora coxensis]
MSSPPVPETARRRRASALALGLSLVVLSVSAPGPAHAAIPPQDPGVTLRTYGLGADLTVLCTLKPGQTPNYDKLMPVINWSTQTDFGIADRFLTQVIANINITTAGSYAFRLTSDDGSRLRIDKSTVVDNDDSNSSFTTVVNHDGVHGTSSKDGTVDLSAGYHKLRIEHFDNTGGQALKLEWQPPGTTQFVVVPTTALSTEAGVTRVTAPGTKECVEGGDTPGDGLPLNAVHPNYALTDLRPSGFQPKVTGMDWLPDNRLAITTWGGDYGTTQPLGEVYLLGNVTGATSAAQVTVKRIATGMQDPMGIKYVDGKLYVSERSRLVELNDTNGDEIIDTKRTVATWPFGGTYHEFAFGLLYKDGYFYLNLSVQITPGGRTTRPQLAANRGTAIKVNKATGQVEYTASGLRTPNGMGWGPEGGIFVTDNQGDWLSANKLVQLKPGRFFNHYNDPAGPFDSNAVTQPVLWLPHNEIANSPSTPIMLTQGQFAGQMLFGDVTYGGIQRGYLEKVNGEYQGAVFRFTQGLEAGISRITLGPDGAIYAGGIGDERASSNWRQQGKLRYGLQKLTPTSSNAFDILAMRAVAGGFELEYTQPLSAATLSSLTSRYQVQQWRYTPTSAYGGPKVDLETLGVTSAIPSADGRKVTLRINGLEAGRVVYVHSPRPFSSASGQSLWSTEAWYTLNALPGSTYEAEQAALSSANVGTEHAGYSGTGYADFADAANTGGYVEWTVNVPTAGSHSLAFRYANGKTVDRPLAIAVNGTALSPALSFPPTGAWTTWRTASLATTLPAGQVKIRATTTGANGSNLDQLVVTPVSRIALFDGTGLAAWEHSDGSPATWPVSGGSMESLGGNIRTRAKFGDFKLHGEWLEPAYPPEVTGQARGNSGFYLQERYEIQVLDSYGDTTLANNEAGAIYLKRAPDRNMATAPNTWQTFDITFRAARFSATGTKLEDARVTVVWNGVVVHNNVAVNGPTGNGQPEGPTPGPIGLQDHGDPGANPASATSGSNR